MTVGIKASKHVFMHRGDHVVAVWQDTLIDLVTWNHPELPGINGDEPPF